VAEDDLEEEIDPALASRHVGPPIRQHDEEKRDNTETDGRELRRSTRRGKGTHSSATYQQGRHFSPYPSSAARRNTSGPDSPSMGMRIKHPATASSEAGPSKSSNGAPISPATSSASAPHYPRSTSHPHMGGRSQSPTSPAVSNSPIEDQQYKMLHLDPSLRGSPHFPPPSITNVNYTPSPHYRNQGDSGNSSLPAIYRAASAKLSPSGKSPITSSRSLPSQLHASPVMSSPPIASGSTPRPTDVQRLAKPKRLKAHTVTTKSYSIPMVPRDKNGKPMLPLNVGIMTVISLGDVCTREHFHTERYIFPVGYEVTRYAIPNSAKSP
jgi:hypothetical protein